MQAIRTRYLGPTDTRSSRIQAKCEAGMLTVNWDHDLDTRANHETACKALLLKLDWTTPHYTPMVGGVFDDDFYWVFTQEDSRAVIALGQISDELHWEESGKFSASYALDHIREIVYGVLAKVTS
jgi:hypothetical protein